MTEWGRTRDASYTTGIHRILHGCIIYYTQSRTNRRRINLVGRGQEFTARVAVLDAVQDRMRYVVRERSRGLRARAGCGRGRGERRTGEKEMGRGKGTKGGGEGGGGGKRE